MLYEPHFDEKTTIEVDDAGRVSRMPRAPIAISIAGSGASATDPERLRSTLDDLADRFGDGISAVRVSTTSRQRKLPNLSGFRRLSALVVWSRAVRDWTELTSLNRLHCAVLTDYDGSSVPSARLGYTRVASGRIHVWTVPSTRAWAQGCSKLARFAPVSIRMLRLERCHHVDLASLEEVRGLSALEVRGRNGLRSVDFVRACPALRHLVVTAAPGLSRAKLTALGDGSQLRTLFLAVDNRKLAEVATFVDGIVTNGAVCFESGTMTSIDPYYDATKRSGATW